MSKLFTLPAPGVHRETHRYFDGCSGPRKHPKCTSSSSVLTVTQTQWALYHQLELDHVSCKTILNMSKTNHLNFSTISISTSSQSDPKLQLPSMVSTTIQYFCGDLCSIFRIQYLRPIASVAELQSVVRSHLRPVASIALTQN